VWRTISRSSPTSICPVPGALPPLARPRIRQAPPPVSRRHFFPRRSRTPPRGQPHSFRARPRPTSTTRFITTGRIGECAGRVGRKPGCQVVKASSAAEDLHAAAWNGRLSNREKAAIRRGPGRGCGIENRTCTFELQRIALNTAPAHAVPAA
jgi:hypothetical protein